MLHSWRVREGRRAAACVMVVGLVVSHWSGDFAILPRVYQSLVLLQLLGLHLMLLLLQLLFLLLQLVLQP